MLGCTSQERWKSWRRRRRRYLAVNKVRVMDTRTTCVCACKGLKFERMAAVGAVNGIGSEHYEF